MPDANLSSSQPRQAAPAAVVRLEGLYNAENLTIANGRVFVTGSKGAYEVIRDEPVWCDETGTTISSSSVAAVRGKGPARRLLIGQPFGDFLRDCELRGSPPVSG